MFEGTDKLYKLIHENTLTSFTDSSFNSFIQLLSENEESLSSNFLLKLRPNSAERQQVLLGKVSIANDGKEFNLADDEKKFVIYLSDTYNLSEYFIITLMRENAQKIRLSKDYDDLIKNLVGIFYSHRGKMIVLLLTLLQMSLVNDYESEYVDKIKHFLNKMVEKRLKNRLIEVMKDLNAENNSDIISIHISNNQKFSQKEMTCIEKKGVSECLHLCSLKYPLNANEIKEVYSLLEFSAKEWSNSKNLSLFKASYSLIFCITNTLFSIETTSTPNLASDVGFMNDFQTQILPLQPDGYGEGIGIMHVMSLIWSIFRGSTCIRMGQTIQSNDQVKNALNFSLNDPVFFSALTFLADMLTTFQNEDSYSANKICLCLQNLFEQFLSIDLVTEKIRSIAEAPYDASSNTSNRSQSQVKPDPFEAYGIFTRAMGSVYAKDVGLDIQQLSIFRIIRYLLDYTPVSRTLAYIINLLSNLVSSPERAKLINQFFIHGYRFCSWDVFLNSLKKYENEFHNAIQNNNMYSFHTDDAMFLEAYANCSSNIMQKGDIDTVNSFSDMMPLYFVLFRFQNVPLNLKTSLRLSVCAFVQNSFENQNRFWYHVINQDLPLNDKSAANNEYNVLYEFEQIECLNQEYGNTLSYIQLINTLIQKTDIDKDATAEISTYILNYYFFIKENMFDPFNQRTYKVLNQKWKLLHECLKFFKLLLQFYEPISKDFNNNLTSNPHSAKIRVLGEEVMKDLMGRKTIFDMIISLSKLGVNEYNENSSKDYFLFMESSLSCSFEILILAFSIDQSLADRWHPHCMPLDVIMRSDSSNVVSILRFACYLLDKEIAKLSLKLAKILNERMPDLASILSLSPSSKSLIADYANCLEDIMIDVDENEDDVENIEDEPSLIIMDILLSNVEKPSPSLTFFLLNFDVNNVNSRSIEQIISNQNCLGVIIQCLSTWNSSSPSISRFQSHGFCLLSSLCTHPQIGKGMIKYLWKNNSVFFIYHLHDVLHTSLPKHRFSGIEQNISFLELSLVCLWSSNKRNSISIDILKQYLPSFFGIEGREEYKQKIYIMDFLRLPLSLLSEIQTTINFPEEECRKLNLFECFSCGFLVENGGIFEFRKKENYSLINFDALKSKIKLTENVSFGLSQTENEKLKINYTKKICEFAFQYNSKVQLKYFVSKYVLVWSNITMILILKSTEIFQKDKQFMIFTNILNGCLKEIQNKEIINEDVLINIFRVINFLLKEIYAIKTDPSSPRIDINGDYSINNLFTSYHLQTDDCFYILKELLSFMDGKKLTPKLSFFFFNSLNQFFHYCDDYVGKNMSKSIIDHFSFEESFDFPAFFENFNQDYIRLKSGNRNLIQKYSPQIIQFVDQNLTWEAKSTSKSRSNDNINALTFMIDFLSIMLMEDNDSRTFFEFEKYKIFERCFSFVPLIFSEISRNASGQNRPLLFLLNSVFNLFLQIHSFSPNLMKIFFEFFCTCDDLNPPISTMRDYGSHTISDDIISKKEIHSFIATPVLQIALNFLTFKTKSISNEHYESLNFWSKKFIFEQQNLFSTSLLSYETDKNIKNLEFIELITSYLCLCFLEESEIKHEKDFISSINQNIFQIIRIHYSEKDNNNNNNVNSNDSNNGNQNGEVDAEMHDSNVTTMEKRKTELILAKIGVNLMNYLQMLVTFTNLFFHVNIVQLSTRSQTVSRPSLTFVFYVIKSSLNNVSNFMDDKQGKILKMKYINDIPRNELQEISIQRFPSSSSHSYSTHQLKHFVMKEMSEAVSHAEKMIDCQVSILEYAMYILIHHIGQKPSNAPQSSFSSTIRPSPPPSLSLLPSPLRSDSMGRRRGSEGDFDIGTDEEIRKFEIELLPVLEDVLLLSQERVGKNLGFLQTISKSLKNISTAMNYVSQNQIRGQSHSQSQRLTFPSSPY